MKESIRRLVSGAEVLASEKDPGAESFGASPAFGPLRVESCVNVEERQP